MIGIERESYGTNTSKIEISTNEENNQLKSNERNNSVNGIKSFAFTVCLVLVTICVVLAYGKYSDAYDTIKTKIINHSVKKSSHLDSSLSTSFTLNREGYDPISYFNSNPSEFLKYSFLSDYGAVIEPSAPMFLYIKDSGSYDNSKVYYEYSICKSDDSSSCLYGYSYPDNDDKTTSITTSCAPYDDFVLSVSQKLLSTDEIVDESSVKAKCMYVRREIRSLTEAHLAETMDTMKKLWDIDEDKGKELYGDNYMSAKNVQELHYFQASRVDADHAHEGLGFLTSHTKMTNYFEASAQLVNPSFSLPYWDFTIESAYGISAADSPMFQPETFGSLPTDKTWTYADSKIIDGAIPDGRWAYLESDENTRFLDMKRAYGYMRAPWSSNPSPYISRFTNADSFDILPTCGDHYYLIDNYQTDFVEYLKYIETSPHGPVHRAVAGPKFGCDMANDLLDSGVITDLDSFCFSWVAFAKIWYRKKLYTLDSDCYVIDNDLSSHENLQCKFTCDESDDGKAAFYETLIHYKKALTLSDTEDETLEQVRQFVCGGNAHKIVPGDHFESASAADPSFWPVHPTMERIFHAQVMANGFTSIQWLDDKMICPDYCYSDFSGEYGRFDSCCDGHYSYSKLFNFWEADRTTVMPGDLTNIDQLYAMLPTKDTYAMTYIYDQFSWTHCKNSKDGDIDYLLANIYAKSL